MYFTRWPQPMRFPNTSWDIAVLPSVTKDTWRTVLDFRYGSIAAEPVKPDGGVCPLLIRLRRHFCGGVNDVKGHFRTHAPQQAAQSFDHLVGRDE